LEPGEAPSYSASHQAPNYVPFLNIAKHGGIMTTFKFSYAQYCNPTQFVLIVFTVLSGRNGSTATSIS